MLSFVFVSMVCVFGLIISIPAQGMMLQNNNFVSEATVKTATSLMVFGSIDSLYNSLMLKLKNKNVQNIGIACRRSLKQDDPVESDEAASDEGVQKKLLFSFEKLQKILLLSLLFFNPMTLFASNEQQEQFTTSCFNVPAIVEDDVYAVASRCPSSYSLGVGLCTNTWAALIAHYTSTDPAAFGVACTVAGSCGFVEGISADNRQGCIRAYSTSYPADQVCIAGGDCFSVRNANVAGLGSMVGYPVGLCLGGLAKKHCCSSNQNAQAAQGELVIEPSIIGVTGQHMERGITECTSLSSSSKSNTALSKFLAERPSSKSIQRSKSFDAIFDNKKD
jgi:hypothetical protein